MIVEEASVPSGTVLAERYEVRRLIGRGGMAEVYEVFDRSRSESVALKLLAPEWRDDLVMVKRFVDEATLTSRLNHPQVVSVYDIEHSEYGEFISMELLRGQTLRSLMQERERQGAAFSVEEITHFVSQLCCALSYAHLFTVHRDLKPENIWVDTERQIKLMDFGLAKARPELSRLVSSRTKTGFSVGTPYYIAPEQLVNGDSSDPAADQYSVAAVVYELFTGEVPAGVPRAVHRMRADIPRRLGRVVERGLARDPEHRFSSIDDFAAAFCEPNPIVRKILNSRPYLVFTCFVIFVSGAFAVSLMEQWLSTAELSERNEANRKFTTAANQLVLHNESLRLDQWEKNLRQQLEWLRSFSEWNNEPDGIDKSLAEARSSIETSRFVQASNQLAIVAIPLEDGAKRVVNRFHYKGDVAQSAWRSLLNSTSPLLLPDLHHLADPDKRLNEAALLANSNKFQEAVEGYRAAMATYEKWSDELSGLRHRSSRLLYSLPNPPLLYTNSVGMVFAKLPDIEGENDTYWVSIWETTVLDFARYVADGLNWVNKYGASDIWRNVSGESLSSPVVGVSQGEAIAFCKWLAQYQSRHESEQSKGVPQLVTDRIQRHMWNLLNQSQEEGLGMRTGYPDAIYAFGEAWPPIRELSGFVGDRFLRASRYVKTVASGAPNTLGLFDCDGNVWERRITTAVSDFPHWHDYSRGLQALAGGGSFGTVTFSDNTYFPWPGATRLTLVGRVEAIGFRVMLSTARLKEIENIDAPLPASRLQSRSLEGTVSIPQ